MAEILLKVALNIITQTPLYIYGDVFSYNTIPELVTTFSSRQSSKHVLSGTQPTLEINLLPLGQHIGVEYPWQVQ